MRTMQAGVCSLAVAVLAVACGGGPTGPDSVVGGNGSTATVVFPPGPVGDARNSCPSDAPVLFVSGGQPVNDQWKNEWRVSPIANVTRYYFEFTSRHGHAGDMSRSETTFDTYDLGAGVYSARVRSYCGDIPSGNWSNWVEFSNGIGPAVPTPNPQPPTPNPGPKPEPKPDPCKVHTTGKHKGCKR